MSLELETWQWALAALAAFGVGLSKTGIAGLGILVVALFAVVIPARESVGVVLPILISADFVAVTAFRRHAVWSHLWRLFPWAALGVVIGSFALKRMNDSQVEKSIGAIVLVMTVMQIARQAQTRRRGTEEPTEETVEATPTWFAPVMGVLAGFTTMVANAAGPVMILFLLAMKLPKMEFVGTAAWFFFVVNLFKVPFSFRQGFLTTDSLWLSLRLAPFAVLGALGGRTVLRHIPQRLFENLALALSLVAALKLLF